MSRSDSSGNLSRLVGYARAYVESQGRNPPRGGSSPSRGLAVVVCTLVLVSAIAPAFAGVAVASSESVQQQSNMTMVPESNVNESFGTTQSFGTAQLTGSPVGLSASEIAGSVMTTKGASSLEVTVTTAARAPGVMGVQPPEAGLGGEETLALVFSDDTVHDGRRVAVPKSELKKALGYVPQVAYGVHENGTRWVRPINDEETLLTWRVPKFSSNTVTFDGEVVQKGSPATDGGSFTYNLSNLDAASDPHIKFTGAIAKHRDDESAAALANGETMSLAVAGNLAPTGPSANGEPRVVFTGRNTTFLDSVSASNQADGSTVSKIAGGDGPAQNVTVTFDGDTQTTKADKTGSGSSGDSDSTSVSGNIDPTSEELTVTAKQHKLINTTNKDTLTLKSSASAATVVEFNATVKDVDNDGYNEDVGLGIDNGTTEIKKDILVDSGTTQSFTFSVTLEPGSTVKVGVMDGRYDSVGSGSSSVNMLDAGAKVDGSAPDVTINSATYDFGDLSAGTTATKSVSLTTGSNTLEFGGYGASDYNLSWTENTAAEDPSVAVDGDGDGTPDATASYSGILKSGQTATVSLATISAGSNSITTSLTAGQTDWTVNYDRVEHTENPSVDIDGDGTTDGTYTGVLAPGETATAELAGLSTSTSSLTVSTASGTTTDVTVEFSERTETDSPKLAINGNWNNVSGRLSDGSSTTLYGSKSSLVEGTNTLDVRVGDGSLSADAPTPAVTLRYNHSASSKVNTTYTGETWSERYNVSKTWASGRSSARLTIPFDSGAVVAVRDVEVSTNGGAWTSTTDYTLNETTLTVNLGSVAAGDSIRVRANGTKVTVNNGSITVTEPTTEGNTLDTEFRIDSKGEKFYIGVGGTASGNYVHYLSGESWTSPSDYATVESGGQQRLYAPDASAGATARARSLPLEANPQTDAEIIVEDPTVPQFTVRPGSSTGDEVEFVWHDTVSGETYGLVSKTRDGYVEDKDVSESPVVLVSSDDDEETFTIEVIDTSSSGGGGGGAGGGAPISSVTVDTGPLRSPLVVGPLSVALILGAVLLARRTAIPLWAAGSTSLLVALLAFESLNPGSVSSAITRFGTAAASGVETVSPALLLAGGAIGLWGVYRIIKRLTRRENVVLKLRRGN